MTIQSHLAKHQGKSFWDDHQIHQQAAKLWKDKRIAMIWVDKIPNDYDRQIVVNVANEQMG